MNTIRKWYFVVAGTTSRPAVAQRLWRMSLRNQGSLSATLIDRDPSNLSQHLSGHLPVRPPQTSDQACCEASPHPSPQVLLRKDCCSPRQSQSLIVLYRNIFSRPTWEEVLYIHHTCRGSSLLTNLGICVPVLKHENWASRWACKNLSWGYHGLWGGSSEVLYNVILVWDGMTGIESRLCAMERQLRFQSRMERKPLSLHGVKVHWAMGMY